MSQFSDYQLDPKLMQNLQAQQWLKPTPIQAAALPLVLSGQDVAGLAQTGTGKTGAFLIPLVNRWLRSQNPDHPAQAEPAVALESSSPGQGYADWQSSHFILILVPTRELADQVHEQLRILVQGVDCKSVVVYGGTGYEKQREAFRTQVDFVVATPGRLIDLYKEHLVDLKQVRAIVFDEADRMFDLGFKDDMRFILQRVPQTRQFLVFSATLNFEVLNVAYQFGAQPVECSISRDVAKAENVQDQIFHVGQMEKAQYCLSLIRKHNPKQVIVFSNYKNMVERIAQFLSRNQVPAMAISSLLSQSQRTRVLSLFKEENEKNVLVATDVAARGLDVQGVDMVINYDLPQDCESYVHRIGRTGRAGKAGQAFSLVSDRDVESLERIEEYLKNPLKVGWMESQELVTDFIPFSEMRDRDADFQDRKRPQRSNRPDRQDRPGGERKRHGERNSGERNPVEKSFHRGANADGSGKSQGFNRHEKPRVEHVSKEGAKPVDRTRDRLAERPTRTDHAVKRPSSVIGPAPTNKVHSRTEFKAKENLRSEKGLVKKVKSLLRNIFGGKASAAKTVSKTPAQANHQVSQPKQARSQGQQPQSRDHAKSIAHRGPRSPGQNRSHQASHAKKRPVQKSKPHS